METSPGYMYPSKYKNSFQFILSYDGSKIPFYFNSHNIINFYDLVRSREVSNPELLLEIALVTIGSYQVKRHEYKIPTNQNVDLQLTQLKEIMVSSNSKQEAVERIKEYYDHL